VKTFALALVATFAIAEGAGAQTMTGYTPANADKQKSAETAAIARPDPSKAQALSKALSAGPHVAGTPGQARTRDYVIDQMKAMGLQTEVRAYDIWMPHLVEARVWRVSPTQKELDLHEGPVAGDATSAKYPETPPINGYGGSGDVSGQIVYANYGLIEDYATLDSLGVSVRGKIVVARYGRSFRGIKAREAEKHGAIALLIYSDPQDDGFVRGDVYPEGPMRPPQGIQRGSVMNMDGDPSTPGYPSVAGAKRIPVSQMEVPHIPVVPIGYGNAAELLRDVRGTAIPQSWQGGMPFRYHVGPGPVTARVKVVTDTATKAFKTIWDTFGIVQGTELPNELVIIGGHRDAWGPGAADNVSGTVSILEAARAVSEQIKAGWKPKRTLMFATWDAEEWGLIGSTEYVEEDSLRLLKGGVAYFNQDVAAQGAAFGGGGSPSLRPMLRDVAKIVPVPDGSGSSVYDQWRKVNKVAAGQEPAMGDPGGGSDFAGFYNHLGIPIAEWGFGGGGGVYHSLYDSYEWMEKFGDPGFKYHATAARIAAAMMMRTANADVIPYDYVEYARTMQRYVPAVEHAVTAKRWSAPTTALADAITQMEKSAEVFNSARDAALSAGLSDAKATVVNAALLQVERALTRPEGLKTRPWFRNLIYVADENNGYATMVFPSINEAIRAGSESLTRTEIADLASRFAAATRAIDAARAALAALAP
jgi:N-acetylated-alpha-linked acidic dipeptidase